MEEKKYQAAIEKSRSIVVLSDEDRDFFLATLKNPPKPNARLKLAFKRYQKKTKS